MNKKFGERLSIFTFLTIISSPIVSAGPVDGLRLLLEGVGDMLFIIIRFIGDIILDLNTFDEYLFIRLLLFLIIFIIINSVLKKNSLISSDSKINTIIALSVSILTIRYMDNDLLGAILLPYTTLGAAITIFLPFMIYFFFIHQSSVGPFGRQVGWVIFAFSFTAIWAFDESNMFANETVTYIYLGGIIFVAIALIFDKRIHEYFGLSAYRQMKSDAKDKNRVMAQKVLQELIKDERDGHYDGHKRMLDKKREKWEKILRKNT